MTEQQHNPEDWYDLCRQIPMGYDPVATAGDCWLDVEAGLAPLVWIEDNCVHVKGPTKVGGPLGFRAGGPIVLETWQRSILFNLFGWKRPDGTRRYRRSFWLIARKNAKSTLLAAVGLYVLTQDDEAGAEIYSAAADRDQVRNVFDPAKGMVRASAALNSQIQVLKKELRYLDGTWHAISADANTSHGYNGHLILVDEVHAQPDRDLVDVLETCTGARAQPLTIHSTTSDFDRPSICNELQEYGENVAKGVVDDPEFLPVIFRADASDDYHSVETWRKANPNLGVSVSEDYLRSVSRRAQNDPTFLNTFLRLHLNVKTTTDVAWLDMTRWDENAGELRDLADRPCFGGLDLSSKNDLTAFVLLFPDEEDDTIDVLPFYWIPNGRAREKEKRDRVPYSTWERQGFVTCTDGETIDEEAVEEAILDACGMFDVQGIGYDRWGTNRLVSNLIKHDVPILAVGAGYRDMSEPTKEFEAKVLSRRLRHGGHPVLRWNVASTRIEEDAAGNRKPSKKKSTQRIDGVTASVIAFNRLAAGQAEVDEESVYESRGLIEL